MPKERYPALTGSVKTLNTASGPWGKFLLSGTAGIIAERSTDCYGRFKRQTGGILRAHHRGINLSEQRLSQGMAAWANVSEREDWHGKGGHEVVLFLLPGGEVWGKTQHSCKGRLPKSGQNPSFLPTTAVWAFVFLHSIAVGTKGLAFWRWRLGMLVEMSLSPLEPWERDEICRFYLLDPLDNTSSSPLPENPHM